MPRSTEATLWFYLAAEILRAQAEERLPSPPRTPLFARETVRPSKERSS